MRCRRCWSEDDVRPFPSPQASMERGEEFASWANLCAPCRSVAPENPLLFRHLFLRFASKKEFLLRYGENEDDAILRWCEEVDLTPSKVVMLLRGDPGVLGLSLNIGPRSASQRGAPYGYKRHGSRLVPEPMEATIVREIFELYLRGSSLEEIAAALNSRSIATRRGGRWQKSTIGYILKNPIYAGYKRRKGRIAAGSHPTLVSPETFRSAQRNISRRQTLQTRRDAPEGES